MIDFVPIFKIMPILLVALMSPGPDFMFITSIALGRGRGSGLLAALGISCGNAIYASLSVLGLNAVFAHIHWLSIVVRVVGGLYLLYLAVALWRATLSDAQQKSGSTDAKIEPLRRDNAFVRGFITNLTNPKALAFFTSIFAFALPAAVNSSTQASLVGMVVAMSFAWFGLVVVALSTASMRRAYMKWSSWIDRAAGTCLGFFGVRLIMSVRE